MNTSVSLADLQAAADDANLTVPQFEERAIAYAVEDYKRRVNFCAALMAAIRVDQDQESIGVILGND